MPNNATSPVDSKDLLLKDDSRVSSSIMPLPSQLPSQNIHVESQSNSETSPTLPQPVKDSDNQILSAGNGTKFEQKVTQSICYGDLRMQHPIYKNEHTTASDKALESNIQLMKKYGAVILDQTTQEQHLKLDTSCQELRAYMLQLLDDLNHESHRHDREKLFVSEAYLRPVPSPHKRWDLQLPKLAQRANEILEKDLNMNGYKNKTDAKSGEQANEVYANIVANIIQELEPLLCKILCSPPKIRRVAGLVSQYGCGCQHLHRTLDPDCTAKQYRIYVALQDITVEMGPICIVPGTHEKNFDRAPLHLSADSTIPLVLENGAIAILDARIVRSASSNVHNNENMDCIVGSCRSKANVSVLIGHPLS